MTKNIKILIAAFLEIAIMVASILLIINIYNQQSVALRDVNANLSADGAILAMKEINLLMVLGDEYLTKPCEAGHKDVYEKLAFTAVIDGDTKRVKAIITENDAHSLYGVKTGEAFEKAADVLAAKGFVPKTDAGYQYIKDDVTVTLICDDSQTLAGFVIETL